MWDSRWPLTWSQNMYKTLSDYPLVKNQARHITDLDSARCADFNGVLYKVWILREAQTWFLEEGNPAGGPKPCHVCCVCPTTNDRTRWLWYIPSPQHCSFVCPGTHLCWLERCSQFSESNNLNIIISNQNILSYHHRWFRQVRGLTRLKSSCQYVTPKHNEELQHWIDVPFVDQADVALSLRRWTACIRRVTKVGQMVTTSKSTCCCSASQACPTLVCLHLHHQDYHFLYSMSMHAHGTLTVRKIARPSPAFGSEV